MKDRDSKENIDIKEIAELARLRRQRSEEYSQKERRKREQERIKKKLRLELPPIIIPRPSLRERVRDLYDLLVQSLYAALR